MRKFLMAFVVMALAAIPSTAEASNERIARRVFDEILSQGKCDRAAGLYAPDFVNHGRSRDVGLEEDQAAARGWKEVAPDMVLTPELVVSEGDRVAVLWRGRGTNTGSGNGIPATGKKINGRGITIWRIDRGRVKEEWSEFSILAMLRQLGLAPGGEPLPTDGGPAARAYPRAKRGVAARQQERNRRVVTRAFEEILGQGKLDLFTSIYATDFVNHGPTGDSGLKEQSDAARALRALVPDLRVTVTQSIAEGDLVAVVWIAEAASSGVASEVPATEKGFRARGMSILRAGDDGRITEEWSVFDEAQVLEQREPRTPAPSSGDAERD